MTSSYPFYESLMGRIHGQPYTGKMIIKRDEIKFLPSLAGTRVAPIADRFTGMEPKTFGIVMSETPPSSETPMHSHNFEAVCYVLQGRGYEQMGDTRIEWEAGDAFYIPPDVPHKHVNTDSETPARILQIEAWPLLLHLGLAEMLPAPDPDHPAV